MKPHRSVNGSENENVALTFAGSAQRYWCQLSEIQTGCLVQRVIWSQLPEDERVEEIA